MQLPPTDYPGDVENQSGDPSNWDYDNYLYDDNGNMIQDLMSDIGFEIYDINNQPVAIYKKSDGTCYQYAYDAQVHRIMKRVSKPEYYLNGADGKTEEIVYNNISKVQYNIYGNSARGGCAFGADMIGFVQRNQNQVQRYYYIKDYLGSNRVVVDELGNITSAEDFGPFGATMEGRSLNYGLGDSRYKFVGNERDVETGCDNEGDRIYDSHIFRSQSVDPFASKDLSRSPYSYAGNNPIMFVDANGDSVIVAQDDYSLDAILKSLRPEDAKHVIIDKNGNINFEELSKATSDDKNLANLKELVKSLTVYEVSSGKGFSYKDADGKIKYLSFGGKASGTKGFTGFTLAPDNSEMASTNSHVQVIINAQNTELGRSLAISHELYSHCLLYDRGEDWMHNGEWEPDKTGMGFHTVEKNIILLNLILDGRKTTIRNFKLWR